MSTDIQAGRLTMRCEGDNWNAYYAPPHDMKCAIFLGSIRLSVVVRSGVRMRAHAAVMSSLQPFEVVFGPGACR